MAFKKGQSGNAAGKPKGAVNKTTSDLRGWITAFIEDNKSQIKQDWNALEPKDRIQLFEKLLKYALPTLQATTLDISFDNLTDDQLNEIVNRIINGHATP